MIGCRDITKGEKAVEGLTNDTTVKVEASNLEPLLIDVTSNDSIKAAVETVEKKYGKLDVLMNNAAVAGAQAVRADGTGPSLREIYHQHYDTNLFGVAETTESFLPLLRKSTISGGKRISFTSSGLSSLQWAAEVGKEGPYSAAMYPIYRSTKTALSMIMLYYVKTLEKDGFVVSASDPGYCATNLNGNSGFKDPRDGAKELVKTVVEAKEKVHGRVIGDEGLEPW